MNSKLIESNSINKLRETLIRCERIIPDIPDNDRTPSWDGSLILYRTPSLKKEEIQGLIHIQVKGKEVNQEQLERHEINYSVEVADLRNFRHVGGTIFFVICMPDFENYKIYYNSLLPLDLEEIFNSITIEQKTKNITLVEFPKNDAKQIVYILGNFVRDSKKQQSTAKSGPINYENLSISQYDSFVFSTITSPKDFFSDHIFKYPTYIYGRKKGIDIDIPLTKMTLESITNNLKIPVQIDGEIFYKEVFIEKACGSIKVKIGAGFEIDINNNKINYNERGNLTERIQDLKFFTGLLKGQVIKIGSIFEGSNVELDEYEDVENCLEFYKSIHNLLLRLNVKAEIDLDKLKDEDEFYKFQIFKNAILNGASICLNNQHTDIVLTKWKFLNLTFAILAKKTDDKTYKITNFFDGDLEQCSMKTYDSKKVPACVYIVLKKSDFLELANINYQVVQNSLFAVPYSEEYGLAVNFLLLEMLSAFDERKNTELINCIITIAKWLSFQKDRNYEIFLLNYFQAIKRTRPLSDEENEKLVNMKDEIKIRDNSDWLSAGINILLENRVEFQYYFRKLQAKEQSEFAKFPIYTLAQICRID